MRKSDAVVKFPEWLPDLPDLNNPGLTEAINVLPVAGTYKKYVPLLGVGNALGGRPIGSIEVVDPLTSTRRIYAGRTQSLWQYDAGLGTWDDVSGATYGASTATWEFVQYGDYVFATNFEDVPQYKHYTDSSNFANAATSGTAPEARRIGKIGQFVWLGDLFNGSIYLPNSVQWSAIDDPNDWPTPGTAGAITVQSGLQDLNPRYGRVMAIIGGDQFGLVFQRDCITRVTYVGSDVVFQFDEISQSKGLMFPHSVVPVNGLFYYISDSGVCVTDGVKSDSVGKDKVDRYFFKNGASRLFPEEVYGAPDQANKLIKWCFRSSSNTSSSNSPDRVLIFNYAEGRFAVAEETSNCLMAAPSAHTDQTYIRAFDSTHKISRFNNSVQTNVSTLVTGESEFNPGGRSLVQGVQPHVIGTDAANISVYVGARDNIDDSVTYTSAVTPNSRTRYANFRSDARYHRFKVEISGISADDHTYQGYESQVVPAGYA